MTLHTFVNDECWFVLGMGFACLLTRVGDIYRDWQARRESKRIDEAFKDCYEQGFDWIVDCVARFSNVDASSFKDAPFVPEPSCADLDMADKHGFKIEKSDSIPCAPNVEDHHGS